MRSKLSWTLLFVPCLVLAASAQPAQDTRSHVERFSTPESRSKKIESDATSALKLNPDDPLELNRRALARLRLNEFEGALTDLRKAIELDPKNSEYWANYGYTLWKLGNAPAAIKAERRALELDPDNYTANYQLGRFLLRTGDPAVITEAAKLLSRAIEIDPRQYEVRFELIAVLRELRDTASALAQLEILEDARPSDPRVRYVTGLLFLDRNKFELGVENLEAAVRADPQMYGAWQDLGLAYAGRDQWQKAVTSFSELSKRQQDSVEAAYLHALALYNAKRIDEAEQEARRALRLNSGFADAHTLLGIILASRGNALSESLEYLSQAAALEPENFDAVFYLGRVHYLMGDYGESRRELARAVALNPRNLAARFYLGSVFEKLGESEKAESQYDEIVKLDAKSFFGKVGLGALYLRRGKTPEAILILSIATKQDPASFEAHWALGRALILAGRFAEAESALRKAVALQPGRTDARYQLGIALNRQGKTEEAKAEFKLVDKINREFREGGEDQKR